MPKNIRKKNFYFIQNMYEFSSFINLNIKNSKFSFYSVIFYLKLNINKHKPNSDKFNSY